MGAVSDSDHNVLPHLLALHNRAHMVLPPNEAAHMRASVLSSSFGRGWNLLHAAHRVHFYQEARVSASPCDLILLHIGKPLRVHLGFAAGKRAAQTASHQQITLIPRETVSHWLWEPCEGNESIPRAEFVHLYLTPELLTQVAAEMGIAPERARFAPRLAAHDPVLWRLGEVVTEELTHSRSGSRLVADAAACQIAVHLLRGRREEAGRHDASPHSALNPVRLRRATNFINEHLHHDISLAEIAEASGMSVFHFARQFKSATGQSPYQFLIHARINRAKTLLQNPEYSVGRVAHAVGFDSHSRFTAQFRRITGTKPAAYRK